MAEAARAVAGDAAFQSGAKVENLPRVLAEKMKISSELYRSEQESEQLMMQQITAEQQAQQQQAAAPLAAPGEG